MSFTQCEVQISLAISETVSTQDATRVASLIKDKIFVNRICESKQVSGPNNSISLARAHCTEQKNVNNAPEKMETPKNPFKPELWFDRLSDHLEKFGTMRSGSSADSPAALKSLFKCLGCATHRD